MKYQSLAVLAAVGPAAAQGVTDKITPPTKAPEGCVSSYTGLGKSGRFEFAINPIGSDQTKRDDFLQKRDSTPLTNSMCTNPNILVAELDNNVLKDALGRTGYIASNYQLQFDSPAQAGAIYTAGFSVCSNGTIALGGSTVFYQCKSGQFWNLYDRWWAEQCEPVHISAMDCNNPDTDPRERNGGVVGTAMVATTVVAPLSDGQPQVITTSQAVPICQVASQIGDGQVQAHTTPCAALPTPTATWAPVSQLPDGQIQVTPIGPVPPAASVPVAGTPAVPTSAGSVSVPAPPASGVPQNGTTFRSTGTPSSGVIANPGPPPTTVPVAPSSGAGQVQLGSAAALVLGVAGVFWFL